MITTRKKLSCRRTHKDRHLGGGGRIRAASFSVCVKECCYERYRKWSGAEISRERKVISSTGSLGHWDIMYTRRLMTAQTIASSMRGNQFINFFYILNSVRKAHTHPDWEGENAHSNSFQNIEICEIIAYFAVFPQMRAWCFRSGLRMKSVRSR